jgi:outer membrane protein assembly factor BamB
VLSAADWPQWRGPNRDGIVSVFAEPKTWPEKLNLKWKITVGEGHSSPIFAAGRIFQMARQQDDEVTLSIDPADGKIQWRQAYPAPYTMNPAANRHGKGPKSTPLYYNGKLYTLGITGTLSCLEATNGRVVWRKDFVKDFKTTAPIFGTAMSPMVYDRMLIAHAGGDNDGALMALDAATGAQKWIWKGDGPAYTSPIVAEIGGVKQVVTQTEKLIAGFSVQSGELLWKIDFTTPYKQNIVTPLILDSRTLILSGLSKGTMAVAPARSGNAWTTEKIWHNADFSMYMNSPVLKNGLIFGFSNKDRGRFFCMEGTSGKILWTSDPRQGENAAIVLAGDLLFLLKDDAELILARANDKAFEPLRRYKVAESPTWAHPLLLSKGVAIKDLNTLAVWNWE